MRRGTPTMTRLPSLAGATLAIALALAGCKLGGESGGDLESAKKLQASGDAAGAFLAVKSVLKDEPESGAARFLLGSLLLSQGEPGAAEVEFRRALAAKHRQAEVVPLLAQAMLQRNQLGRLIEEFGKAQLDDATAQVRLQLTLATAQAMLGQRDAARATVDRLLAQPLLRPDVQLLDAKLRTQTESIDKLVETVRGIVAADPGNGPAWQFLGNLLAFGKRDRDGAIEAFRKALALNPRAVESHAALIAAQMQRNDPAAVQQQIDQMHKVLPQHPLTRTFEAQLAFLKHDYVKARELSLLVLRNNPENLGVLQLIGATELQSGSLLQAETYLSKAMSLAPDLALPRTQLAQVYLRSGHPGKVLAVLAPLLSREDVSAEALQLAAESQLNLGQSQEAEQLYARAAKIQPNDTGIRTALALAQYGRGDTAALGVLSDIATRDKGSVADLALISTHIRRRDLDAALAAIAKLEQKLPDTPMAPNLRGSVQAMKGDRAGARASFEAALKKDPQYFIASVGLADLDMREGKPEAAQQRFEALVKANPKNVQASLGLADVRLRSGAKRSDLTPIYEAAVKANPTDASARAALVNQYLAVNDTKNASTAAQQAVALLPASPEALESLGRAQQASGELNQALTTFAKLAAMLPKSPKPHLDSARLQLANKNPKGALSSIRRALELDPRSTEAQRLAIATAVSMGKPEEATELAKLVQKQHPDQAVGHLFAGDIEVERGNWAAAATAYRGGLDKANPGKLPIRLHLALKSGPTPGEADRFADKWLKDHPLDGGFLSYLGEAAVAKADLKAAEMRYEQVLKLQPNDALAMNNLAFVRLAQKKPGARELAEKANILLPDQGALLDTLALARAEAGDFAGAVQAARRAVSLTRNEPAFRLTLASVLLRSGDKAAARTELEALAAMGSKFKRQKEVSALLQTLK